MSLDETSHHNQERNLQSAQDHGSDPDDSNDIGDVVDDPDVLQSPDTNKDSRPSSQSFSPWMSQLESARITFNPGQSTLSQVGPHRRASSRAGTQCPMKRTARAVPGRAVSGLEEHLTAFFDPVAREK